MDHQRQTHGECQLLTVDKANREPSSILYGLTPFNHHPTSGSRPSGYRRSIIARWRRLDTGVALSGMADNKAAPSQASCALPDVAERAAAALDDVAGPAVADKRRFSARQ